MPRPITFKLGPFTGGMLLNLAEHLIPPTHATIANDLDNTQGTLRGLYGLGTSVETLLADQPGSVFYVPGSGWVTTTYNEFICYDSPLDSGADDPVVYITQQGDVPRMYAGGTDYDLGIDPPAASFASSIAVSNGGSGGVRAYAITLKNGTTGWESNPIFITDTTTGCNGAVISGLPNAADVDSGATLINIYGTTAGSLTGPFYFLDDQAIGSPTSNFTDTAIAGDVANPLEWTDGGNPDNEDYPFDHNPAPGLTVLSDAIHSFAEGQDTFGQGILFGAVNKWLAWSQAGYPAYWPRTNWQKFDSEIEAIISDVGVTFVLTRSDIYAISGTDDTSLTPRKTGAAFGVRAGAGHTVKRTPYGILFLGPLGLAVFNGDTAQYLDEKMTAYDTFDEDNLFEAVYHDQYYWLLDKTQGIVNYFDLSAWPNVQFFRSLVNSGNLTNLINAPYASPAGLYVVNGFEVQPWMPRRAGEIAGAGRESFAYESPKLTAGMNQETKFIRYWINKTGTVELNFYVDDTLVHTGSGSDWLPRTAVGKGIQVQVASVSDASTEVFELVIEAEAFDG